jgi:hypothetical protein
VAAVQRIEEGGESLRPGAHARLFRFAFAHRARTALRADADRCATVKRFAQAKPSLRVMVRRYSRTALGIKSEEQPANGAPGFREERNKRRLAPS